MGGEGQYGSLETRKGVRMPRLDGRRREREGHSSDPEGEESKEGRKGTVNSRGRL